MTHTEFRAIRDSLGLSRQELADILGVTRVTVNRVELPPGSPTHEPVSARLAQRMLLLKEHGVERAMELVRQAEVLLSVQRET